MKFVNLLKSRLILNILLFLNVCKQIVHMSHVSIFQKVKVVFHMKTKILADFQICISVPVSTAAEDRHFLLIPMKSSEAYQECYVSIPDGVFFKNSGF